MQWRACLTLAATCGIASAAACGAAERATALGRFADEATSYAVQRLALDSLFNGRERAGQLVLWANDAGEGPVIEVLGSLVARPPRPRPIDVTRLDASLPARVMTELQLRELFRRNPDAWAAFFRDNPAGAGLVELSPVLLSARGDSATTWVGRSCGEHCRNAWRIVARRNEEQWRIVDLRWIHVPGV